MKEPTKRIVALHYKVCHEEPDAYADAAPLSYETPDLRVEIKDKKARFELKSEYDAVGTARRVVDDFIRKWKFFLSIERGSTRFSLRFERPELIYLESTPGVVHLSAHITAGTPTARASLRVVPTQYPPAPPDILITPDVETMGHRYVGYRQGKEPLPSMAYFVATYLEYIVDRDSRKQHGNRQQAVVNKYAIAREVLQTIRDLSSKAGGTYARKAVGVRRELTSNETEFLKEAIKRIIVRVAEKEHDRDKELDQIRLSGLPPLT